MILFNDKFSLPLDFTGFIKISLSIKYLYFIFNLSFWQPRVHHLENVFGVRFLNRTYATTTAKLIREKSVTEAKERKKDDDD